MRIAYSKHLLSGMLRCAECGARMIAQTATRRKGDRVHRYVWYRCGYAKDKGPTVCGHATSYRQDRLESVLISRFRDATANHVLDALTAAVNHRLAAAYAEHDNRASAVKAEILVLERQAGNLSRAIRDGLDSVTVRADLVATEQALSGLRLELTEIEATSGTTPPVVQPGLVRARLGQLERLLREDIVRARVELQKHLEGDLRIRGLAAKADEPGHPFELTGRVKADSLLALENQEAV